MDIHVQYRSEYPARSHLQITSLASPLANIFQIAACGRLMVRFWQGGCSRFSHNSTEVIMKIINSIKSLFLVAILLLSGNFNAYGYDLFGSDIGSVNVVNADQCAAACNSNNDCLAWTFVRLGLKSQTSAVCFLKNPVPAPSWNSVCQTNFDCVSGYKQTNWCGDKSQGDVLSCPSGTSCNPRVTQTYETCWIFFKCRGPKIQTTDYFCQ